LIAPLRRHGGHEQRRQRSRDDGGATVATVATFATLNRTAAPGAHKPADGRMAGTEKADFLCDC